ncbi:hypothetical protein NQZ68_033648 [Dissostichus eleginoides]|nr:hypothetical protein NQZ68_033648 [Dissostichus eleginoides]
MVVSQQDVVVCEQLSWDRISVGSGGSVGSSRSTGSGQSSESRHKQNGVQTRHNADSGKLTPSAGESGEHLHPAAVEHSKQAGGSSGSPCDSQLPASPASPSQDIWVLRSSPTGKGVCS